MVKAYAVVGLVAFVLWTPVAAYAQSQASIAVKTCTLTMSAAMSPDGTSGWSVQFKRNSTNQGQSDSTAPYGPRSATVTEGAYVLTAVWTKTGAATITEPIGTATCDGGQAVVVPYAPPPPPPAPVNCVLSEWTAWSGWMPISSTEEQRTRTRMIVTAPLNGGVPCGVLVETETRAIVVPSPSAASPEGTVVPPASSITDSAGAVWTFGAQAPGSDATLRYVLRNGVIASGGYGFEIRYVGGSVYVLGSDRSWYRWDGGWVNVGTTAPGGSASLPTVTAGTPFQVSADHDGYLTTGYALRVDGQTVQSAPASALSVGVIQFTATIATAGSHALSIAAMTTAGELVSAPLQVQAVAP